MQTLQRLCACVPGCVRQPSTTARHNTTTISRQNTTARTHARTNARTRARTHAHRTQQHNNTTAQPTHNPQKTSPKKCSCVRTRRLVAQTEHLFANPTWSVGRCNNLMANQPRATNLSAKETPAEPTRHDTTDRPTDRPIERNNRMGSGAAHSHCSVRTRAPVCCVIHSTTRTTTRSNKQTNKQADEEEAEEVEEEQGRSTDKNNNTKRHFVP